MIYGETYQSKTARNAAGELIVLDAYDLHSTHEAEGSLEDLKAKYAGQPDVEIHENHIKLDLGRTYGIHAYTILRGG
jgi:hypothetical protein